VSSYHDELQALAIAIGSDGCTHASDLAVECCWEHDWSYVTGMTPRGVAVTKAQADERFRDCLQAHSTCRWLSPLAWWRWLAVREFGRGIWARRPPTTETLSGLLRVNGAARWRADGLLAEAQAVRRAVRSPQEPFA
jgi:hypothetical protein